MFHFPDQQAANAKPALLKRTTALLKIHSKPKDTKFGLHAIHMERDASQSIRIKETNSGYPLVLLDFL